MGLDPAHERRLVRAGGQQLGPHMSRQQVSGEYPAHDQDSPHVGSKADPAHDGSKAYSKHTHSTALHDTKGGEGVPLSSLRLP